MAEEVESASQHGIRLALLAVGLGVGGFFISFITGMGALLVSAQLGSDGETALLAAIWFRGLGALLLVSIVAWRNGRKWRPTKISPYIGAAALGYAINPMTWEGTALIAELVTKNVLLAIVLDGAFWIATFVGFLLSQTNRRVPTPSRIPVGYEQVDSDESPFPAPLTEVPEALTDVPEALTDVPEALTDVPEATI